MKLRRVDHSSCIVESCVAPEPLHIPIPLLSILLASATKQTELAFPNFEQLAAEPQRYCAQ